MWDELTKHLPDFESAILTGLDPEGYPFGVRCHPDPRPEAELLRLDLAQNCPIQVGPASLLCHRHDEKLWNLKSFLVRGTLERDEQGWTFQPRQFIPGAGIGGPMGMVRFVTGSRRTARRYLQKRGLSRPKIPWDDVNAAKAEVRR